MARWRLQAAHYLNVPGTEWEYKEVDRNTGKQGRKVYIVPMYLHPENPLDHNHPGEIIVAQGKNPNPKDIIFIGEPTPDMEPIDDEAQAITDQCKPKWQHPIDSLPANGDYSASLLSKLERQLDAASKNQPTQKTVVKGIDPSDFVKLQEQVVALMARNLELETKAEQSVGRRRA